MKPAGLFAAALLIATVYAGQLQNKTAVASYDPAELLAQIFKPNGSITSRQRGYGLIKFEDQDLDAYQDDQFNFEDNQRPLRFEEDNQNYNQEFNRPLRFEDPDTNQGLTSGQVVFQDDNRVENQNSQKKKKRRRRRKPKNQGIDYPGVDYAGLPPRPGYPGAVQGVYGLYSYGNPGYPGGKPYRRPRRPRPSIASGALTAITEALTSIATYDDYQCVPRLLCEAAGGGSLGDNGVLQSIAGIQPLLTLLSAYNGVSASPLFVFGRAVFLGMTSKGNTGTCRYAYPQCPTDPEQLIHYLNNHNGGFFRFFSNPQANQNLEQFYNQLGQGYGLYQPQNQPNLGQNYGLYPGSYGQPGPYPNGQNFPEYQNPNVLNYNGVPQRPGLYGNQNYGLNYAFDYNTYGSGNQIRFKDSNRIEKRIQNNPMEEVNSDSFENDYDTKTRWSFPDDITPIGNDNKYKVRDSRTLKFPDDSQNINAQKDSIRKGKRLVFSSNQNSQNNYNNYQHLNDNYKYQTTTYSYYNQNYNNPSYHTGKPNYYTNYNNYKQPITTNSNGEYYSSQDYYNRRPIYTNHDDYRFTTPNYNEVHDNQNYYNNRQNIYTNNYNKYPTTTYNNDEYVFDYKHNFYVKREKNNINYQRMDEEVNGIKTVYVVRGNGDPSKPEIVKLRPGQSVQ